MVTPPKAYGLDVVLSLSLRFLSTEEDGDGRVLMCVAWGDIVMSTCLLLSGASNTVICCGKKEEEGTELRMSYGLRGKQRGVLVNT